MAATSTARRSALDMRLCVLCRCRLGFGLPVLVPDFVAGDVRLFGGHDDLNAEWCRRFIGQHVPQPLYQRLSIQSGGYEVIEYDLAAETNIAMLLNGLGSRVPAGPLDYATESGITRSEAVRRLIEAGLKRPPKGKPKG